MIPKYSCTSSTYIPRETSIPRKGVHRLPQQSNRIPTDIRYTPTTYKQENDTDNLQLDPPEHLTWDHKDTTEVRLPNSQLIITNCTTHNGTHLIRHPVPHQDQIPYRDLSKKLPHSANIRGTGGRTHTHRGGI